MFATLENTKAVEQEMSELAVSQPHLAPSSNYTSEDPWTIIEEEDCEDDFVVISGPAMVQPWVSKSTCLHNFCAFLLTTSERKPGSIQIPPHYF
jgi:hypothetical protein